MSGETSSGSFEKINSIILLLLSGIFILIVLILCNGTSDSGDSIQHYMFAKYAPDHPELFFNHWAKPVFTLLSSPFAHYGFIGIKIFNAIISFAAVYLTFLTAKELKLKSAYLGIPFFTFSTIFITITFSGLTEPLFACWLIASIYLLLQKKLLYAAILISFLSFVRTEGLFFIGIFGLYYLLKKENWKYIPFLLVGNILYSIIGFFWTKDILWVIHANPYAGVDQAYGTGKLFHFTGQLIYILGIPVFILFLLGLIGSVYFMIKKEASHIYTIIVFGGFFCFFIAHSVFWYSGIFGSMGLTRVFMAVLPLMILIALYGWQLLDTILRAVKPVLRNGLMYLIILFAILFPFINNPASVNWEKRMMLTEDQKEANVVADFVQNKLSHKDRLVFSHPYLAESFNIDPFDHDGYRLLKPKYLNEEISEGDVLIWDNWFCTIQFQLGLDELLGDQRLEPIEYNSENAKISGNYFHIFIVEEEENWP